MRILPNAVLILVIFVSSLALIVSRHESRMVFAEWQKRLLERDELDVEWGRLQLEQSTWATPERIEKLAKERLRMAPPTEVIVLSP
jgi:cell division protein FtsL